MARTLKAIRDTVNWARRNGLTGDFAVAALSGGVAKSVFAVGTESAMWIAVGFGSLSMTFGVFDYFVGENEESND